MTPAERNAVLEEAALWHDMRTRQIDEAADKVKLSSAIQRLNAMAQMHEESAAAIRALKEQEPKE